MSCKILCLEGPDGAGKTTIAAEVARITGAELLRCPGSTRLGELLRGPLKDPSYEMSEEAMTLAFAAADVDCHRLAERWAAAEGALTVMDRCGVSNFAYRIAMEQWRGLELLCAMGATVARPRHSCVALLHVEEGELRRRVTARGGAAADRFDGLGESVREAYGSLEVGRYVTIEPVLSASWTPAQCAESIIKASGFGA